GTLYVAELEGKGIAVIKADGTPQDEINLSDLDPDGIPNFVALHREGGLLYAFAALWDDTQQLKPPRGPGRVAVVDLGTRMPVGGFDLSGRNPLGWVHPEPGTPNVLIAVVEDYGGTAGGIERVDLAARTTRGLVVTAAALGNRYVSDFVLDASGAGFVSAVDPASADGAANLYRFTLAGQVGPAVLTGGHAAGLAIDPLGHLWVVGRGYGLGAPNGLRVLDVSTGGELTGVPIQTSLPPRFWGGIVFLP